MNLKSLFLTTLLLVPFNLQAQEVCRTPESVKTEIDASIPNAKVFVYKDMEARELNSLIEAIVNSTNPFEYDTVEAHTVPSLNAVLFVFYKNNCATSSLIGRDQLFFSILETLNNRRASQ